MYMTQSSHGRYSHPLLVPGILCVWIKRASGVALGGFYFEGAGMSAERRIRLCELLSSGQSETTENLAAQLCDSLA